MDLGLNGCQEPDVLLLSGEGGHSDLISCATKDDIFGVQIQNNPVRVLRL